MLTCKIVEEDQFTQIPIPQFLGPDGNDANSDDAIELIGPEFGNEMFNGMITSAYTMKLKFSPLKTSHKGNYTCLGEIKKVGSKSEVYGLDVVSKFSMSVQYQCYYLFL